MSSVLTRVLEEMGWGSGFAMPAPNDENKALMEAILKNEKTVELEHKFERNKDQKQCMVEFFKNLKREEENIGALCRAKDREEEAEMHLRALAERESGRLEQDTEKKKNELRDLGETRDLMENQIFKAKRKLDEFRTQMTWDQQTLDYFLEDMKTKDDYTMDLIKYNQQDEQRIKSLCLLAEKMILEANAKYNARDQEMTETQTAQIALDKTIENLQRFHLETQRVIHQWENTIKQIKQRDDEMEQSSQQIAQAKQNIREKQASLAECKLLIDSLRSDQKETVRRLTTGNQLADIRQDLVEKESNCSMLQDEVNGLKCTLDRATSFMASESAQIYKMKNEFQDNSERVKQARTYNGALEGKLRVMKQTVLSEEERTVQIDQLLRDEEQAARQLHLQLNGCRKTLFSLKDDLHDLKIKEKEAVALVSRNKATISNLKGRQRKVELELGKREATLSRHDAELERYSSKVAKMLGFVQADDEKKELEERITQLTEVLNERTKTLIMFVNEMKQCEDDICSWKKEMERSEVHKTDLNCSVVRMILHNNTTEKELKKLVATKQDRRVEQFTLKIEVKRKRTLLYSKADSMLSMEKRKLKLQATWREREEELKVDKEMLVQQLRLNDKERQTLGNELNDKQSKITVLKNIFETLSFAMAGPEGEERKSQAYFITQVGQEKEELKQKGSSLDALEHKIELENSALESAFQLSSRSYSAGRKSLSKDKESTPEFQEKLRLEKQTYEAEEMLKLKKKRVQALPQDLEQTGKALESLLQEEQVERDPIAHKQALIGKLNKEVASQWEKIDRVMKQCSKQSRAIRSSRGAGAETMEDDITLRELREFNKGVNKALNEALDGRPDLRAALERYFLQAGLYLPPPSATPSSRRSSRASSAHSSASSHSPASSGGGSPRASLVP